MQLSKYEEIGVENLRKLVRDFYLEIRKDELLAPMYRDGFEAAEERLHLFMVQYLGGPATYSEQRGHPRLRKRHAGFTMNEATKNNWLKNMEIALNRSAISHENKEFLSNYFTKTAEFLIS